MPVDTPAYAVAPPRRRFVPQDYRVTDWAALKPLYQQLLDAAPDSPAALEEWLHNWDELDAIVQEEGGWRYIRMTCDTTDTDAEQAFQAYIEDIVQKLEAVQHRLRELYYHNPHRPALDETRFRTFNRILTSQMELFREENLPLLAQAEVRAQHYGVLAADMTLLHEGREYTLQEAAKFLEDPDRETRETVWRKITNRRLKDKDALDDLFDELLAVRTRIARNAGFDSYTDYKYKDLGRFDYTRADVAQFHAAIAEVVTPLYTQLQEERRQQLGVEVLRPWDLAVDPTGGRALAPFATAEELTEKSIAALNAIRPELGAMLRTLQTMGHLDLASRKGKAPGGYNYPLNETGVPFIFMNAVGLQSDLTTLVHEAGHAVHSIVVRDLPFNFHKDTPSEVAELASMSMELLTMDHWDVFYPDPADLRRAQLQQLDRSIGTLVWVATVDAFQTWLYDHPDHTRAQRRAKFVELSAHFLGTHVDYTGYEDAHAHGWHRQLHIFEVPFYYIEYGMAQLGAFQVWRNYQHDPTAALDAYLNALKLGYTQPIPAVYAAAGIRFAFDAATLHDLFAWVWGEYKKLAAIK